MVGDAAPEKPRILIDDVGRRGIAQLPVHADFVELEEQGVRLARVERIAHLADQVGGAHQPALQRRLPFRLRRKARRLDRVRHALRVDGRRILQAFESEQFRAIDMIGRQGGVRGAARQAHFAALHVGHEFARVVASQRAAYVADVMQEATHDEMRVIFRLDALRQDHPLQDVSSDQRH